MAQLPDELVKEILSPALQVSEEDFSNVSHTSPFSVFSQSTSAYLVVCKSWLRVATPLLYNVVVLRSTAQAKALERALRGNKLLGTFIKKLRVEGGFGLPMHNIIACAPNVTDLWLSLDLRTGDSVAGLCRGLPKMNPIRVILYDVEPYEVRDNAPGRKLVEAICECIESEWDSLETLECPFMNHIYSGSKAFPIAKSLIQSLSLKTLVLKHPQIYRNFFNFLTASMSLQRVRVVFQTTGDTVEDAEAISTSKKCEERLRESEDLKDFVSFEYPENGTRGDNSVGSDLIPFPPQNPSFVPLQSSPLEIQEEIWNRILHFAMFVDEETIELVIDEDERTRLHGRDQHTKINLLLVSKLFHKLGRPHCYRCLIVTRAEQLQQIAELLEKGSTVSQHIRSVYTYVRCAKTTHLLKILERTTGLLRLVSPTVDASPLIRDRCRQPPLLTFRGFTTLAKTSGPKLLEFSGQLIERPDAPKSPAPLFAFTALTHLEWNTPAKFNFKPEDVPRDALGKLETLSFSSHNDTFLRLLGCMDLHSLRRVLFTRMTRMEGTDDFLLKHGSKIIYLETHSADGVFTKCPALRVLCISGESLCADSFAPHPALTKFIFTRTLSLGQIKTGYKCLGEIDFGIYPSLEEVKVHVIEWPTTEREINKGYRAIWVTWSERLTNWQVKLTDKQGQHWIPRLK